MKKIRVLFIMIFSLTVMSCQAYRDQKIDLTYEQAVNGKGGSGELFISKPTGMHNFSKKSGDLWIIGMKNHTWFGGVPYWKTADVVTDNNIGDWIVGALLQELKTAGYDIKIVTQLPPGIPKGMDVSILRVFVYQNIGFFTQGAISEITFNLDIWKNGIKVKTINVAAKGDYRSIAVEASTKVLSLKEALQAAMKQSIPEVINTLEH